MQTLENSAAPVDWATLIRSTTGMPGVSPRIADTRLETETSPSQNPGNWNAFGAPGAGNPEDANGNIVAPVAGAPLTP